MARAAKLRNGLTSQQNNFKTLVLKQLTQTGRINGTQAALESYNTKDTNTAAQIASDNLRNPHIQQSIEETAAMIGLTPSTVLQKFSEISLKEASKWTGETILKANIEIAKILGMYPGSKHARLNVNIKGNIKDLTLKEVEQQLKEVDAELAEVLEGDTPGYTQNSLE